MSNTHNREAISDLSLSRRVIFIIILWSVYSHAPQPCARIILHRIFFHSPYARPWSSASGVTPIRNMHACDQRPSIGGGFEPAASKTNSNKEIAHLRHEFQVYICRDSCPFLERYRISCFWSRAAFDYGCRVWWAQAVFVIHTCKLQALLFTWWWCLNTNMSV